MKSTPHIPALASHHIPKICRTEGPEFIRPKHKNHFALFLVLPSFIHPLAGSSAHLGSRVFGTFLQPTQKLRRIGWYNSNKLNGAAQTTIT